MTTLRLPEIAASRLHFEFFLDDGTSRILTTKRCQMIQVEDNVVDVAVTPMVDDCPSGPTIRNWGSGLRIRQCAAATVE